MMSKKRIFIDTKQQLQMDDQIAKNRHQGGF